MESSGYRFFMLEVQAVLRELLLWNSEISRRNRMCVDRRPVCRRCRREQALQAWKTRACMMGKNRRASIMCLRMPCRMGRWMPSFRLLMS